MAKRKNQTPLKGISAGDLVMPSQQGLDCLSWFFGKSKGRWRARVVRVKRDGDGNRFSEPVLVYLKKRSNSKTECLHESWLERV